MHGWISFLGKASQSVRQPRVLVYALLLTLVTLVVFQDRLSASVSLAHPPGYLDGQVLTENGQVAQGAEIFFKVQKAFGASCYSKECDSFQNAIFRKRLSLAADGSFEIRIPGRYMNPSEENKAYVYTLVVRTPDGKFRPFYAFEIGRQERIVNEFVLRPPFLEILPGGENDLDSTF